MKCRECDAPVLAVTCEIDPRTAERTFLAPCFHYLSRDDALVIYRTEFTFPIPKVTGAALITAERRRHHAEEGHTGDSDAALTGGELAWSAWCLLDRAGAKNPVEQAPALWPLPRDRWPFGKSALRLLIIAGSFIAAEIDRRLAAGEKP